MMTCDVDDGMMYHVQSLVHGRKGGIHEHVLLYSWSSSYERRMAFQPNATHTCVRDARPSSECSFLSRVAGC